MDSAHKLAEELIDFIYDGASPFHVVERMSMQLDQSGFESLELNTKWALKKGGKYYIAPNGSSLFAFVLGTDNPEETGFRIVSAHSDSPTFRIKPSPEMGVDNYYVKLNTEVYGGPILMSWLDRPLSIAGRVSLKSDNPLWPDNRLVNFNRPLVIIPNLAIHLNRTVNDGVAFNRQKDLLPLLGILPDNEPKEGLMTRLIASEMDINQDEILDYDLTLNEYNKGCIMGLHNELISSPKLDNLAMTHAGFKAFLNSQPTGSTQMLCIFDNEEVGSLTKQGAGSPVFRHLFERILNQLGKSGEDFYRTVYNSFMISADMVHSIHPNHEEKHDPVLHPLMNKGPVIKITANQKYTSDSDSIAVFESICQKAGVPYQKFLNRSDMPGGSTLGNVSTGQLDIRTVDIGNAMLAMHSVRELSGVLDHEYLIKVFQQFYKL